MQRIKDLDFLDIEDRVNAKLTEVIVEYINDDIQYIDAIQALEKIGVPSQKAEKLLELGLESIRK